MYEYAFLNSNPDQNLFYNLCKGSKHTYGAAGHYVSYLYCRSLSHVEITLMNAYIKGAISKQILRYLATFKRERDVKLVASFASSSHRFAPVEYVGQNDYMALSILQQAQWIT